MPALKLGHDDVDMELKSLCIGISLQMRQLDLRVFAQLLFRCLFLRAARSVGAIEWPRATKTLCMGTLMVMQ